MSVSLKPSTLHFLSQKSADKLRLSLISQGQGIAVRQNKKTGLWIANFSPMEKNGKILPLSDEFMKNAAKPNTIASSGKTRGAAKINLIKLLVSVWKSLH